VPQTTIHRSGVELRWVSWKYALLATATIGLSACSQQATRAADAGAEGGVTACNTLLQRGNSIEIETTASKAPAANGGRIQDGTYVLTKLVVHDPRATTEGKTGVLLRRTIELTGSSYAELESDARGEARSSGSLLLSDKSARQLEACVAPDRPKSDLGTNTTVEFSASDAGLQFHYNDLASDAGVVTVTTYQPRAEDGQ
jgi:hypothetical protein